MQPIETAKNRGYHLLQQADAALESGLIDEQTWYQQVAAVITPAYLAADNPRAQSGHSGDETRWKQARGLITDAIDRHGSFLDMGCANGYLLESLVRWTEEQGIILSPFGVDIAPELVALARHRLPHWSDRFFVGNALYWNPPQQFDFVQFDFVRTGLEYVPRCRQNALVSRLLSQVVAPGGRLIIGVFNEEPHISAVEEQLKLWGFWVAGKSERPHSRDQRLHYKILWIEKAV